MPRVSVVIAIHNGAATLVRALDSVAAQTYHDIEIIAVNDGSTDNTQAQLTGWQNRHSTIPVTILKNDHNVGLTVSLNHGVATAKGEYVARLDADDWWEPTKLAKQVEFLHSHPDHGIVGCWYINQRHNHQAIVRLPTSNADIRHSIFWRNPFGHSCVLIDKALCNQVGGYDTALRYSKERIQFGKPIGQFQLQQKKLAEMITEITKAQLLAWRLGVMRNAGTATSAQISMAKRNNVDMAINIAREARQMLGGMGITGEYSIMRHSMNLESVITYEGTHDIHLLITGLDITGLNAFN